MGVTAMLDALLALSEAKLGPTWGPALYELVTNGVFIVLIMIPLFLAVAYLTLWERKLIGWMQIRIGPNRVGPAGLLQPIADGVKLLFKEVILPAKANKALFVIAPMIGIIPALAAWAVVPFAPEVVLSDINAGLLYIMALTSFGVYGVIIAGWASNSRYAFFGAMRSAAQMVSYELAMGFALVVVLMVSGSLNLSDVIEGQGRGYFAGKGLNFLSWNWLPLLPMLVVGSSCGAVDELLRPNALDWEVSLENVSNALGPFDALQGNRTMVPLHMMVESEGEEYPCCLVQPGSDRTVAIRAFQGDTLWIRVWNPGQSGGLRDACVLDRQLSPTGFVEIVYDDQNPRPVSRSELRCFFSREPFETPHSGGSAQPE